MLIGFVASYVQTMSLLWIASIFCAHIAFGILMYRFYIVLTKTGLHALMWSSIVSWAIFPIVWSLSKVNWISAEQEMFTIIVFDVLSKVIFTLMLLYGFNFVLIL